MIEDPHERFYTALRESYAYHRSTEPMMTHVLADARDHPVMTAYHAHWQRAVDALVAGWRVRGRAGCPSRRNRARAPVRHLAHAGARAGPR